MILVPPKWRLLFCCLGALLGMAASPSAAQSIDPRLLESLQSQLGSPADAMRPAPPPPAPDGATGPIVPGGRVDTSEEQEVRRALARRELADLYRPTPIELDFRQRTGDPELRQFGYDLLRGGAAPTGVRSGAVGNDYVLGIGDELQINFRGATNQNFRAVVDRDGRIVVGNLRPVQAAGRSLGSVRAELAAETGRTMLATDIFVSVGDVRAVSVFVGGEVERPGTFNLTSVSDVATAIAQAGGVRRSGSLRQVRLVRAGGGTVTVDLYGLLGIGSPTAIRLRDGDRIIVPVIGPTVAVTGAVARPGIYELRGAASVSQVVAFAGGSVRQRGAVIAIGRIAADGTETFLRAVTMAANVVGGDAIQLVGGSAGGAVGRVRLEGNVDNPGTRPLVVAGTVAELVGAPEDLRSDTYQLAAILVRRDASTGAPSYEMINLAQQLRERPSLRLQSEDRLVVFGRADIAFMNSALVRQIVLGRPNRLRQCRSLEELAALIRDAQGQRFSAVTRGGFVVQTGAGAEIGAAGTALGVGAGQSVERFARNEQQRQQGGQQPEQTPICPEVFEQDPELLTVLLEHAVSVGGAVRRPGAYPVGGAVSARDMALIAEGLISGSRGLILDINRAQASAPERLSADPSGTVLALTQIGPGDDLRFNAVQTAFESSGILLSGEVARPGLYTVSRGEKLSELIARAGGLTEQAYAFGTVFTRESVRRSQEEGFRRTARELYNGLLSVTARSREGSGGTEGLAGAIGLIQALSTAEAPGRVVVEADPRVLAIRPDLDTILEGGDAIFIPRRPNFVLALGDVNNAGALQHIPGKPAVEYLREAGGTSVTADRGRIFIVLPNGTAQPVSTGGWSGSSRQAPPPGSTLIVPKNIDPLFRLTVIRDITTIIAQLATSVATVAVLATR